VTRPPQMRPTWAEINLSALESNFNFTRKLVGDAVEVMAVVKADAYGHGAVECAFRLQSTGANWFGVTTPEEGIELRNSGITRPILILGGYWHEQAELLLSYELTPVIFREDMLGPLNEAAAKLKTIASIHVKIDTGMGRLGVRFDGVEEFARASKDYTNLKINGLMTHFASADLPTYNAFTRLQAERYEAALAIFETLGISPQYHDLANSAATVSHPMTYGNLVRPGGILYGLWADILQPGFDGSNLKPVMSVYSEVTLLKRVPKGETLGYGCTFRTVRESLIATIPMGYHDGLMRGNSNKGSVIVRGVRVPIVGRVSMDLTILDVTDVPDAEVGDRVTVIGTDGMESISAEEFASTCGTLSYEVTCGISSRVPRVYVN
jgi:alanine racemase